MRTILTLILLAAVGVVAYYYYNQAHPEVAACSRVASLCADADARGSCDRAFGAILKAGPEAAQGSARCVSEAQSCAAATGCLVGGVGGAAAGAAGEFLKGLGKSLEK